MITPRQCRAARELLGWDGVQLATASKVAAMTIHTFELGQSTPIARTRQKLCAAFESAGIEFFHNADGLPRVRLRKAEE